MTVVHLDVPSLQAGTIRWRRSPRKTQISKINRSTGANEKEKGSTLAFNGKHLTRSALERTMFDPQIPPSEPDVVRHSFAF